MLESISSRIAREKAEREKFAKQRQESAGTRRWATTFGTLYTFYLGIGQFEGG
jgi:D-lactate dehydrogenase (cytochrome)